MKLAFRGLALLLAACVEETTSPSRIQSYVTWLEWPTAVTLASPGFIRVIGHAPSCGDLVLTVTARYPRLSVEAEIVRFEGPCRAIFPAFAYDTTFALPRLDASQGLPAYYSVEATSLDRNFNDYITRVFGILRLDSPRDTTTVAAGQATLVADSLGCAWARVESFGVLESQPVYVVLNPPDLGSQAERPAFIGGRFVPANPARCGRSSVLELAFAEIVAALP